MWISKSLTLKNIVKLYLKTDKLFRFLLQALPISRKKPTVLQESTRTCTDYLNRRKKENNATPRLFWFKCVLCF